MSDPVSARLDLPDPLIAVVGATDEPGKYGGRIYRDLKAKGYRVVAVNLTRPTVDGDVAYKSVSGLPQTPDIVNVVIPPPRTLELLDEIAEIPDVAVWIQPGAADDAVRDRVRVLGLPALIDACIMVQTRSKV
ncbi:MAG: CoA-binding protein [Actinomycetota bacterium]|nr:CoA-binding protein [Actinomycetota bacterium]MDK1103606.1 CoA-binding protein [Actinomycetota bacterium]MDK1292355.1 CoA-binding protein [Actinomycetota bacterium]